MKWLLLTWRAPFITLISVVLFVACLILSILCLLAFRPGFIPEIWRNVFGWWA